MEALRKHIRSVENFPIDGVIFRDITPLLENHFTDTIKAMASLFSPEEIAKTDAFAGIDARGFIFAAGLATYFGKNFKMIRKAGKIPPPFSEATYQTEYSTAGLQVGDGTGYLIVIDDVLATGGTLTAAADLCVKAGYEIAALAVLIDLPFIHNHAYQWAGLKPRSLISYAAPNEV